MSTSISLAYFVLVKLSFKFINNLQKSLRCLPFNRVCHNYN